MGYPLAKRLRLAAAGGVRVVVAAAAGEPEPEQLVVRGLLARVAEVVTDTLAYDMSGTITSCTTPSDTLTESGQIRKQSHLDKVRNDCNKY